MSESSIETLRQRVQGHLIVPEDGEYDEARKVFNAMIDKRPALVVRCASTADVVAAVAFARERGLPIAVRSGGHSIAGWSVCEGGLLIDLRGMNEVAVDPVAKRARAGGGTLWGEFDAATQAYGLHTPGGRVTTTGVGGFTTGGGYGWTSSKYGLASDNLVSAEVVLADGRVVTASEDENADLFWGIRGGGGNFGIVTEFEFRLHELGPLVLGGLAVWPIERASGILRAWRDYVDTAPDELSTAAAVVTAPPEEFVPDELKGRRVVGLVVLYVGDPADGAAVVQPLKDLGPAVDLIQPMPYTAFQAFLDPFAPAGFRGYFRGEYLSELSDKAIDTFVEHAPVAAAAGAPLSQMIIFRIGQGVTAVPDEATAFSHRDANYLFHPISVWAERPDDDRVIAANRDFAAAMRPFGTGAAYLNFTVETDRVHDAFGERKYERLVALKDKYDPDNLFRLNQNIGPARQSGAQAVA